MFSDSYRESIHQLVELQASQTPDAVAIAFQQQQLTYRELNQKANQLAHYLRTLGVQPDVLVGICVERSLDMFVGLLGILKAGGAYIPLDPNYPPDRLAFIMDDAQLPILLTQQHLQSELPSHAGQTVCIDDWHLIAQQSIENPQSDVQRHHLAYVIYTSGSTGKPKGVQITHGSLINLLQSMQREPGLTAEDTLLAITTISFDLSVPDLYLPLITGARIRLIERDIASDAARLAQILSEPDVTFVQATPATWQLVLSAGWQGNQRLKILCGGEALTRSLANQLLEKGESLWHMYGPTETTVWSMVHRVEPGLDTIPLGRPIANTQIYLIDELARRKNDPLKMVPIGTPGELYIGGDGVARGYRNRPELTGEKFIPDPFTNEPGARLYKTGDLARYRPDGTLEFIGRIDHQVKIRGHRVELGDIESALSQHPQVREATVIAKEETSGSKRLIAYVVPKHNPSSHLSPYTQQVQQWGKVWDDAYRQSSKGSAGVNNSFTGQPLPDHEVQEWVDSTVDRILALQPQRVLEVGCGKGLLLFRIAPHCHSYYGTDISPEGISHIKRQIQASGEDWSNVVVSTQAAHELQGLQAASFDTIIINSVIQYFPSVDYLVQVIKSLVTLVAPGGRIFIGDVRSLPLLNVFHTGVQLSQVLSSLSSDQLKQRIRERTAQDRELVIHPDLFTALQRQIPQISHLHTHLKRGYSQNELIRFRSDVILHVGGAADVISESLRWDWQQQDLSLAKIRQFLKQNEPESLRISQVPNARVLSDVRAAELLESPDRPATAGELREALQQKMAEETGIHPESFWHLSQEFPYKVHITWSDSQTAGVYDVLLCHHSITRPHQETLISKPITELKPLMAYANNPHQINEISHLIPQVRAFLKEKLPDYMVPSAFVVMDHLPLTPNGKIDRRSLPEPKKERPSLTESYVAPSTPLEQKLAEIWSLVLEIDQIGIHDNFFELGGHSLLTAQILQQIEEAVQVELPLFYLLREPTIVGLVKAIEVVKTMGAVIQTEEAVQIDWQAETVLEPDIRPEVPFIVPTGEPEHIFLTGATGFLGAFLLHELLQHTQANIYCLVRATSLDEGRHKIQSNLERYMIGRGELNTRIIPILGDLSQPSLGLTTEQFNDLANKLDLIYHCGAFVNLVYPYNALRAANVGGTKSILRLACQGKVTPAHFISTVDIFFQSPNYFEMSTIREDEPIDQIQQMGKGYAQTKWVAEKLILEARSRGLPVCIYRPGMLTGHSQTGASQTDDLMCRIIKGVIQLGSAPELEHWVNMTPIDYASRSIVHLSRQPSSWGKTFHIVNPQSLSWNSLIQEIRRSGYPIQSLSYEAWQTALMQLNGTQANALMPMRSLFTEQSVNQMTYLETFLVTARSFDSRNTRNGLANTTISCPRVDRKLLSTYFSFFTRRGFLPQPPSMQGAEPASPNTPLPLSTIGQSERRKPVTPLHRKDLTS